ncbi:ABC1 family-domain-containing protein [Globomyces pollinis-pini]|nr:ABC1 family-domain-containing protein [Globomyces pollinis-pini]
MQRLRPLAWTVGAGLATWAWDKNFYYSTLQRNLLTLYSGVLITLDFKLNFTKEKSSYIDELHERVSDRILNVCKNNGGLYIKFGQQIATVPVLPPAYLRKFKQLFDDAPSVDLKTVKTIFRNEFGLDPEDIFESFSPNPVASASIAQVHKATLKDGTQVAVKIQKPEIAKQTFWDMLGYRIVIFAFEKVFDIPLYWSADYIEKHLRQETDFVNEARNAERCHRHIKETNLNHNVYVPKVYHDYSSKQILTSEWIEGVPLTDESKITKMGFSIKKIMTDVVDVFSDQIFRSGFVHCDPHPGNILIRKHPSASGPQVVLIDHGLYVNCTPEFRHDYAIFWKSLFTLETDLTAGIVQKWGIGDAQMFASATLARPWRMGKAVHMNQTTTINDVYESHQAAKTKMVNFLKNTETLPKELIFVGRNLNCVRANNKILGSPVNRINLMASYAAKSIGFASQTSSQTVNLMASYAAKSIGFASQTSSQTDSYWRKSIGSVIQQYNYFKFQSTLLFISIAFHTSSLFEKIRGLMFGSKGGGFEGLLDAGVKKSMEEAFPGMVFDENAFNG